MTLGRSLGGPVGGALIDYLGWRWLFLVQVPFIAVAFLLVAWKMNLPTIEDLEPDSGKSSKPSWRRIDYLGSLATGVSVVAGLLLLDMGGQRFPWISPTSLILALVTLIFGIAFFIVEAFVATEPVFSLHLLRKRDVVLSYVIMPLQSVAQMAMMFFVPLYFQVTAHASNTVAGAHLAPAVAGNAIGSLMAGVIIHRTGRFKSLGVSAGLIGASCYLLLILRWKGHTGVLESFYIIPGGFGMGICQSVIFLAMASAVEGKDVGMATSGLFQTMNIAVAVGLTASTSTLRVSLKSQLDQKITGPDAPKVSTSLSC
jgi:predicted MFS family arabinose efflux permease